MIDFFPLLKPYARSHQKLDQDQLLYLLTLYAANRVLSAPWPLNDPLRLLNSTTNWINKILFFLFNNSFYSRVSFYPFLTNMNENLDFLNSPEWKEPWTTSVSERSKTTAAVAANNSHHHPHHQHAQQQAVYLLNDDSDDSVLERLHIPDDDADAAVCQIRRSASTKSDLDDASSPLQGKHKPTIAARFHCSINLMLESSGGSQTPAATATNRNTVAWTWVCCWTPRPSPISPLQCRHRQSRTISPSNVAPSRSTQRPYVRPHNRWWPSVDT